jgi:hypothetical protein
MNTSDLQALDCVQLDSVLGGAGEGQAVKAATSVGGRLLGGAGRVAGKLAWPITAGMAAYDGYNGYSRARANGASVPRAIGEGGLEALNGATFGLSNWVLGR